MALSKEQEDIYRKAMDTAKKELDGVDERMQEEIQKARQRLAELQDSKRHYRQIYEGTAQLLGIEVAPEEEKDLERSQEEDEETSDPNSEKQEGKDNDSESAQAQTT